MTCTPFPHFGYSMFNVLYFFATGYGSKYQPPLLPLKEDTGKLKNRKGP